MGASAYRQGTGIVCTYVCMMYSTKRNTPCIDKSVEEIARYDGHSLDGQDGPGVSSSTSQFPPQQEHADPDFLSLKQLRERKKMMN